MKIITLIILLIIAGTTAHSQKAKATSEKSNFHYMQYALDESYNTAIYALTVTEQTSCGGLIPYSVKKGPFMSNDNRVTLYTNPIPSQAHYFKQSNDLTGNLITKKIPFTHFEIETGNIELENQTTKSTKTATKLYYLEFSSYVPISFEATFYGGEGTKPVQTADTSSSSVRITINFPMSYQFGATAPDIKQKGYPTEGELLAAWKKYGKKAQVQWRDKAISLFISPLFKNYKKKYITYSVYDQCKIYSDKNKKGGYEEIVSAAELFIATFDEIEKDFKQKKYKKYWVEEYQNRFLTCNEIWGKFLETHNFDFENGSGLVSAEYLQKMYINYLKSLIYLGRFDEFTAVTLKYGGTKFKNGLIMELGKVYRLNESIKLEFEAHATEKGWVRNN